MFDIKPSAQELTARDGGNLMVEKTGKMWISFERRWGGKRPKPYWKNVKFVPEMKVNLVQFDYFELLKQRKVYDCSIQNTFSEDGQKVQLGYFLC
jgi:hypothetical protein